MLANWNDKINVFMIKNQKDLMKIDKFFYSEEK